MRGRITKIWSNGMFGQITGEDGVQYYFNKQNVIEYRRHLRTDYIVEFVPTSVKEGAHKGEPEATHIVKVGHGKHHPLAVNVTRIAEYIMDNVPDDEPEKPYRLRDLRTLYNYFCNIEDSRIYVDPQRLFNYDNTKED